MSNLCPSLIILVTVSAALGSVRTYSVMESSSNYSCCNPTIEFDQNCTATFIINNTNIADSDDFNECFTPCKKMEAGRMTLDQCVDVKVIQVCTEGSVVTEEKRIDFHGEPGSGSNNMAAGNQGSVGSLLLVLGIAGCL